MGTESSNEPLIMSTKEDDNNFACIKKPSFLLKFTKRILKFAMWFIFISWAGFIFFINSASVTKVYTRILNATNGTLFGVTGSIFLIYSGPVIIIAFLSIIYLRITGEEEIQEKKKQSASIRFWTFPVIINGPFGVITATELIGILLFVVYIIWAVTGYSITNFSLLPSFEFTNDSSNVGADRTALRDYWIILHDPFLFLPIARGSVLLRLINIPFEHASRYHVWLGHLIMLIFTLHSLFYAVSWTIKGILIQQLTAWRDDGIANLPGVISLLAGLLMWMTTLPRIRKQKFELFFYTHQLYVIFLVFMAMHIGDFYFSIVSGGIFLFMLDRFLRFFQSRKTVDILSAKCLPSGAVELVISKPEGLRYNSLSWVLIQIRELSWLQWHSFAVSSSPLDGKHHLSVIIKVLGNWTEKLRGHISRVTGGKGETDGLLQPNFTLKAAVEGPYGHESPYHLTYENLILVAGSIGISQLLAILSDILHRIRESKPCLPRNILIVWAVKNSDELPLFHSLDIHSLCPYFYNVLNLEIQTYVTQESEPPLEEVKIPKYISSYVCPASNRGGMSSLVGTGNVMWFGAYMVVSTTGLVVLVGLLDVFHINPHNITQWWYKGVLFIICMVASVILFGGFVIDLWHLWDIKTAKIMNDDSRISYLEHDEPNANKNPTKEDFFNIIKYGKRPDFKEIFGSMAERWGNVDIGVMACGPTSLQTSIAKECRSKNFGRKSNEPIFHFNSHGFTL